MNQASLVHRCCNRWRNVERSKKLMGPNRPGYSYHPKASKSWLIVKEAAAEEAKRQFSGTGVQITTEGKRLLGAAIANNNFEEKFTESIISLLVQQVSRLAEVTQTFEQTALVTADREPNIWLRYVDDTFITWPYGRTQLVTFLDHLNGLCERYSSQWR